MFFTVDVYIIEGVFAHVPGGERLIVGEDDRVVLGVRLLTPLLQPRDVVGQSGREPPGKVTHLNKPGGFLTSHFFV